jgi:branched-chain amino acid transport system substrate-binding protein
MKRAVRCFLVTLAFMSLASCAIPSPSSDTLKIGVNLELSGPLSFIAQDQLRAIEMATAEINAQGGVLGKPIELVVYDNATDITTSEDNTRKLITQDSVVAIIGASTSAQSFPIAELAKQYQVVGITPTGANASLTHDNGASNPWYFRAIILNNFQGRILANFAVKNLQAPRAFVVGTRANDLAQDVATTFDAYYQGLGGTLVGFESYDDDAEFDELVERLRLKDAFDVLLIVDFAERSGYLIEQLRQAGFDQPILGTELWGGLPELMLSVQDPRFIRDVYFTSHFSESNPQPNHQVFDQNYRAFSGKTPEFTSALAYDAFMILIDAIERAGSSNRSAIRDALAATRAFEGITGTWSFDANNNPMKSTLVVEVQNGASVSAIFIEP